MTKPKYHPAAGIFPMVLEAKLRELADDIKANGLRVPIKLCDGKIIDGRNRWLACELARVEPEKCDIETDDPVAYVLSMNLKRRHLSTSQLAMVGARTKEAYAKAAKERERLRKSKATPANLPESNGQAGDARDQAAAEVGVSGRTIDAAATVLDKGSPVLIKAVDAGMIAASTARSLTVLPKAKQTIAAYGKGLIELEPVPKDTPKKHIRKTDVGGTLPQRTYTQRTVAKFLGKTEKDGKPAEAVEKIKEEAKTGKQDPVDNSPVNQSYDVRLGMSMRKLEILLQVVMGSRCDLESKEEAIRKAKSLMGTLTRFIDGPEKVAELTPEVEPRSSCPYLPTPDPRTQHP